MRQTSDLSHNEPQELATQRMSLHEQTKKGRQYAGSSQEALKITLHSSRPNATNDKNLGKLPNFHVYHTLQKDTRHISENYTYKSIHRNRKSQSL